MRKLAEKVALVAQICITLVFVITTLLYMANLIPQQADWQSNGVLSVLMIILGLIYVGISAYLLYVNFSERENLRRILLFCDSDSATHTNINVIRNIASGCAKQVDGLKIRKIRTRADEKGGFIATVFVRVSVDNVAESVNKLRCLLTESFKNTLGLTFNTINFNIERLSGKYKPNVPKAEELAKDLQEKQEITADNYAEPLADLSDNVPTNNTENSIQKREEKETVDA